jgi:hypothetical protein
VVSGRQGHAFAANFATVDDQPAQSHGQFEPSWACAAGIEVEHSIPHLLLRDVAVPGNYNVEAGSLRFQIELC